MKKLEALADKLLPQIPIGLGEQLLRKKFGKHHSKMTDLILKRISIEVVLMQEPEDSIKKTMNKKLKAVLREIDSIKDYLRLWYVAYLNLCSGCSNCKYNCKDEYCKFYGKKHMPVPDPNNPNKTCPHQTSARPKKMCINN